MVLISSDDSIDLPKQLREKVWLFPPDRGFSGGRAWWLDCSPGPVLIDCPPVNDKTINSLKELSSGRTTRIILTNRDSHGSVSALQQALGWPVLLQEQEAYLLPGISNLETFEEGFQGLRV